MALYLSKYTKILKIHRSSEKPSAGEVSCQKWDFLKFSFQRYRVSKFYTSILRKTTLKKKANIHLLYQGRFLQNARKTAVQMTSAAKYNLLTWSFWLSSSSKAPKSKVNTNQDVWHQANQDVWQKNVWHVALTYPVITTWHLLVVSRVE